MADNCKGKSWWEPGGLLCHGKDAAEDGVGDIISGQMKEFAQSITDMVMGIMKWFNTWWMSVPGPDLESGAVTQVTTDLSWYTGAFAIVGLLFALVRLVMSQDFKTLISNGLQPIVNLIIVTACYATGLTLLITAGDKFSTWILNRATTGLEFGSDISALVVLGPALGIGGWIIFGLLALIGSGINVVFMLFRNVMMTVLMVFLPTLAAASGTESGKQAFSKANGYLLAFVLFKPVAAVIYALGLRFVNAPVGDKVNADDLTQAAIASLMGLAILLLAALALPALMKFLIPVAATGAGGFSGGAALAGAVTIGAGAAVLASTGGAGAGAGAGTGAGSKAAAAQGESSAATQGSTGNGSSSTPPGGGESPAGTGSGSTPSGGGESSVEGGSGASESSGADSGDSGGEQAGAGAQPESGESSGSAGGAEGESGGETSVAGAGAGSESAGGSGEDAGATGAGSGSESAGGSGADAGATGAGSGTGGGGRSLGDAAAVMGAVSDATSGASVEKAIEDE